MSKSRNVRSIGGELARRGYARGGRPRTLSREVPAGMTRRDFLGRTAGSGLALGLPTLLAACGGSDDAAEPQTERRTLFFNFAHENYDATEHFLVFRGQHHRLVKVKTAPEVLARERQNNSFLRGVPDGQITHHIENFEVLPGVASLVYVTSNVDPVAGTWEMSSVVQILPTSGAAVAFERAQARGPVPHSLKRKRYGQPAAQTTADLVEESAFLDTTDHARTLVAMLPDMLCADPGGAYHICTSHIQSNSGLDFLSSTIQSLGAAQPQKVQSKPNTQGWATLVELNDDTGKPYTNSIGLRQYLPDWHPDVDGSAASLMSAVTRDVKDDETLGINMTGLGPASPGDRSSAGKLWNRVDGEASVSRSLGDPPAALGGWTLNGASSVPGLYFNGVTVGSPDANGAVLVTLPKILNLFLRFLGAWATFIDPNGNEIKITDLPAGTFPGRNDAQRGLDKDYSAFLGLVPPPYTIAGIPVGPGWLSPALLVPKTVHSIDYRFAGLGMNGSWDDPRGIMPIGGTLTGLVNVAIPALFMAAGVVDLEEADRALLPILSSIAGELVAYIAPAFDWTSAPTAGQIFALFGRLLGAILNGLAGKGLAPLVGALLGFLLPAEIIDAIPIAGIVARCIAAAIGALVLGETLIELGLSPAISTVSLVGTHELLVTVHGDPTNGGNFPNPPADHGPLYYKITYQFDSGAIHTMDAVPVPNPLPDPTTLQIRLVVPRGGKVCVSIGFYANASGAGGQGEWCGATGSSGPQDNTIDTLPAIVVAQNPIQIVPGQTKYIHTRKTQLDPQGQHVWQPDPTGANPPKYIQPPGGQQAGQLGALRSITVRQHILGQAGYLGYSWGAYSDGLLGCSSGARGQFDLAANLGTDAGNAQSGYATLACGLQGGGTSGVTVSYNLLNEDGRNIYFDSETRHVRPVSLATPPAFATPPKGSASGQSFGQLNFASTRLLLHPMGFLVSINNASHTLETLKMPAAPLTDEDASRTALARVASGKGTRPGLMTSPVAAAVSADGVVLVLEDGTAGNRLLAFDVAGNPLPYFKNQKESPYWLRLTKTVDDTYIDIAVEFTGYIYVLSQDPDTQEIDLNIYHPVQADTLPLCSTQNVNGGAIAVDYWRALYTLNYEVLTLPNQTFPSITEPSVSLWMPN